VFWSLNVCAGANTVLVFRGYPVDGEAASISGTSAAGCDHHTTRQETDVIGGETTPEMIPSSPGTYPAIGISLSSRNNEDQVSDMVLYLMSHDPADIVQRQGPLLGMSQRHSG
jgi:hypothetical protein